MDEHVVVTRSAVLQQLGGTIRALLFWGGGYIVAKGWLDNSVMQALVPLVMTLGAFAWQQFTIRWLKAETVKVAGLAPEQVEVR